MKNNEIILLNNIIKSIYTIKDLDELRYHILDSLAPLIPYRTATFYMGSGDPKKPFQNPVARNESQELLEKYANETFKSDYTRWHFMSGKTIVYRETDLYPEKMRKGTEYYKQVFTNLNQHYSAQMGISHDEEFLGVMSLFRSKEDGDFSDDELFKLELLMDHIENRLYYETRKSKKDNQNKKPFDPNYFFENYGLTFREIEVLKLLLSGATNEEICEDLVISQSTTKKHTLNIYKKLGINHRWELIKLVQGE